MIQREKLYYTPVEVDTKVDAVKRGEVNYESLPIGLQSREVAVIGEDGRVFKGNATNLFMIPNIETLRNTKGKEGEIVTLAGYYEAGDKEPLNYKWTNTQGVDDGGSVINAENGSWKAIFNEKVDIRHFGSVGDDSTNNDNSISKCVQYCELNNGVVYIPNGRFKITQTIDITPTISIIGNGQTSVIRPYSCDALNILRSDGVLPRVISDFWIYGESCENNIAIKSTISIGRATGININRVGVSWIGKFIDFSNIWHSTISDCYAMVSSGITLKGSCVKVNINNNVIISNVSINSTILIKNGIDVLFANSTRCEDVSISKNLIFGFEIAVNIETVMFCNIIDNDLDYCINKGIKVQQADSILNILNNWIAQYVEYASTKEFTGISLIALGSKNNSVKNIENNTINGSTFGGYGIDVRANQNNTNIKGNTINGYTGIYLEYWRGEIKNNAINSEERSIFLAYCGDLFIDSNYFIKGYIAALQGLYDKNISFGQNNKGVLSTGFKTKIVLPANTNKVNKLLSDINVGLILDNPSKLKAFSNVYTDSDFDFGKVNFNAVGDVFTLDVVNQNTEDTIFFIDCKCFLI